MNKGIKANIIWGIFYPLCINYCLLFVGMVIARMLFGNGVDTYMLCQLFATLVTIPILYIQCYRKKWWQLKSTCTDSEKISSEGIQRRIKGIVAIIVIVVLISTALNNILTMMPFTAVSKGYQEANTNFYSGRLIFIVLGAGIFVPILEELLHRGIIFKNIRLVSGFWTSALLSAFLFGLIHANIVQFIYAFLIGILLSLFLEKEQHMLAPIVGHITANLFAIFRTKSEMFGSLVDGSVLAWGISVGLLVLGCVLVLIYWKKK